MATNQQMREGEMELARIVRSVARAAGGAAEAEFGSCTSCRGGVVEKRGNRWRCKACNATFATNPSAPPPPKEPQGGHTGGNNWQKHTTDHPSRTGQKKKLRFRRKKNEAEEELDRITRAVGRVAAEAEW